MGISGSRALVHWGDSVVWEVKGFLICLGCHWKVLARAEGCLEGCLAQAQSEKLNE